MAKGHVRLCAGCNRAFLLPWVPDVAILDPPPFHCNKCTDRHPRDP